jgi:hypothetical protein
MIKWVLVMDQRLKGCMPNQNLCLQGVCDNGRKNILVIFWNSFWWMSNL